MNEYIVVHPWESETLIEKSRFICHLQKVTTEEEAQVYIKAVKKNHRDATHNCSAYVIGKEGTVQKASDDGEPSGTAGLPMLEVLRKKKIYNTVAVVTRYFGGIKLGAGGLVRAYTNSVAEALEGASLGQVIAMGRYSFVWELEAVGKVLNILYQQQLFTVGAVEYGSRAKVNLALEAADKVDVENWLTEKLSRIVVLEEEEIYGQERLLDRQKQQEILNNAEK